MSRIDSAQTIYLNSAASVSSSNGKGNISAQVNVDGSSKFDRIVVLSASIPKSYYGNQAGFNYFTLTEGAQSAVISLTAGNYTRNSIATTLTSLMTAGSPNSYSYVMSYPNAYSAVDTGMFTWTVSGNSGVQPQFTFDSISNLNVLLGFDSGATYSFAADTLTAPNVANLQSTETIQVHSTLVADQAAVGAASAGNSSDILLTLPANVMTAPFANIGYQCTDAEAFSHHMGAASGTAGFYLTAEDGTPINLNGVDWQMTLLVYRKNTALNLLTGFIKHIVALIHSEAAPSSSIPPLENA